MNAQINVLCGIDAELSKTENPEKFLLAASPRREDKVWRFDLQSGNLKGRIDESLEGADAWWPGSLPAGTGRGAADILAVVPEDDFVVVRNVTGPMPATGDQFWIYPIRYLERLREVWSDNAFAASRLRWWDSFRIVNTHDPALAVNPSGFPWLRGMQKAAFQLPGWRTSFLFGPPGTGKTTTLGTMLASLLRQHSNQRVLLLSTTNSAVDQALIEVDRSLTALTAGQIQPSELRRKCLRIGSHFNPTSYAERTHLLPVSNPAIVAKLMEHHKNRPLKVQVAEYAAWKLREEALRQEMQGLTFEAMKNARLLAMTTTSATYRLRDLEALGHFDLVVFDEASQVSLVHALTFTGLGKRILFAGDPKQLAPIVQSPDPHAEAWLGKSPFERMPAESACTVMLNEQSRMALPICDLVSQAFYDGKLRVAADKESDAAWLTKRQPLQLESLGKKNAYLVNVQSEAVWRSGSPIRYETADLIVTLVQRLLMHPMKQSDILVLTPYRAQRTQVRKQLTAAGFPKVGVSTVHRAQGSECNTIIFDPVQAASSFLNNEDLGPRLMNVALSRAEARLILIASPENLKNPFLARIANIVANSEIREFVPLENFVERADFPACVVGRNILLPKGNGIIPKGRVASIEGTRLVIVDFTSGVDRKYEIGALKILVARKSGMQSEIERLKQEQDHLKKDGPPRGSALQLKVSEKGALSVYGLGRFPVTLYSEQWVKLLDRTDTIRRFIAENSSQLKAKPKDG